MSRQLQKPRPDSEATGQQTGAVLGFTRFIANDALILGLALILIPTTSGVALIA